MRRLLWCLPVAALGVLGFGSPAAARPDDDDFQPTLTTTAARPAGLPAGVEPVRPPSPVAAPAPAAVVAGAPVAASSPPPRPPSAPNPLPLPDNAKPWMICAATFIGPGGAEQANQVARELRDRHHLTAYIYNRADEERQKQWEEWQARQKKYPTVRIKWRGYRVSDQYAVLIDGFKDFDSATAYLPHVKALPLTQPSRDPGKSPFDTVVIEQPDFEKKRFVTHRENMHSFAMVVRNPKSVSQQPNRPRFDPILKKLNAGVPHCLLDNPKRYSLLVKEYAGLHMIQSQSGLSAFLTTLGMGDKGSTLDAAAMQAGELVRFLRTPQLGFEAYVLHARQSSKVYVGGFDGPDDPALARVRRQLTSMKFSTKEGKDVIGLLPSPLLIEIPREEPVSAAR